MAQNDSLEMIECSYEESCDFCACQESRHYCALHTKVIRDMDTQRCKDWTDRDTGRQLNAREA